jgi:hypothetical protein
MVTVTNGEPMRFMLCTRDRSAGAIALVSEESFATRREAIEAISRVPDVCRFAETDVFLVDLDVAVPVAVVACSPGGDGVADAASPDEVGEVGLENAYEDDLSAVAPVAVGMVEIDIEAWTCEDCIYISTCAKVNTIRPAECGAFQWRA